MTGKKYTTTKKTKSWPVSYAKNGTHGEAILWDEALRAKKFHGYQFNRQFCMGNYIVDFISRKLKLIIEVDGYSHNFKYEEDKLRTERLSELGYTVVRFTEREVRTGLRNVVSVLESYLPDNS